MHDHFQERFSEVKLAHLECLAEVVEADEGGAVVCSPLVVGRGLQVLEQEWLQVVRADEVSSQDGEQPPALLSRLRHLQVTRRLDIRVD